jgi:hypothetical protein
MSNDRRFVLPVVEQALDEARRAVRESPTVDAARERLGGRARAGGPVGDVVALETLFGTEVGVVLFRDGESVDVWTGGGRVRRVAEDAIEVRDASSPVDEDLRVLSDGVRVFATLDEGERVRFEVRPGELDEALLVEKCRFGGLVVTDAGKVMAVGFQKLWPKTPYTSRA